MRKFLIPVVTSLFVFFLFFVNVASNVNEASGQVVSRTLKGKAGMYHLLTFPTRFIPYRTLDNNMGAPNVPLILYENVSEQVIGAAGTDASGNFSITADMNCQLNYTILVVLPINVPGGTFRDVIPISANPNFCGGPYEQTTILGHELRWAGDILGPLLGSFWDGGWGRPTCKTSVGQPVNVTNGNMYLSHTDYVLSGKGEAIDMTRSYNSASAVVGIFGSGWATDYDENITVDSQNTNKLRLGMPDGRAVYFERTDANSPFLPSTEGFYGEIEQDLHDETYTVTFQDGKKHHFSPEGKLLWLKDRDGLQTTLTYTSGDLSSITDHFGRVLNITMKSGHVTQISDGIGLAASYSYNTDETLSMVEYPDGSKYEFAYATVLGRPVISEVKDALGNVLEAHLYDSQGRATTSEKDGGIEKYTLNYVDFQTTVVTDALGRTTTYIFNNTRSRGVLDSRSGNCGCGSGTQSENYFYDSKSNLVREVDALGRQTTYTHDTKGNVLTKTSPVGTVTYTYNEFSQILTLEDAMGGVWTNTYDTSGNLLTATDPLNHTMTLTYSALGLPETLTDARNHTTTLGYDTVGRLDQITDADSHVTQLGYDDRARLTSVTNSLNETRTFEYDSTNHLKKVTHPDSNFVTFDYDTAGRRTSVTDERGNATTFVYDNAYRLKEITDALSHTTAFDYDLMSNMLSRTDAVGNLTEYEYDNFNRLKHMIYPEKEPEAVRLEEFYAHDEVGNVIKKTDTAGRETHYRYDTGNRLDRVTDPLNKLTNFTYNARSQVTKVKDALNQEYDFTYNPLGRTLSQTRAGSTMSYEYDENGNLTERTDHNGVVTTYTYDDLDQLTHTAYTGSTNFATYGYDALSRLTSAQNQNGTVTIGYNNRGWVNTTTDVHGHTVGYGYDDAGNRDSLVLDNNAHTSYVYDTVNRLTILTDESSNNFTFDYDAANRLITKTLPNNVVTTYNYDGMTRLTRLKHENPSSTLFDYEYGYNDANQISQITDLTQTRDFSYDNVNRLTGVSVSSNPVESYTYDGVGNRTSSHLNSSLDYNPFNRLHNTDAYTYRQDPNGNLEDRTTYQDPNGPFSTPVIDTAEYKWDEENRLTQATVSNDTQNGDLTYEYDALGRRVKSTVDSRETDFVYDGLDVLMDEGPDDPVTYQNGPGIDNKLKLKNGSDNLYFLQDHLGSTVGLAKNASGLSYAAEYDSFGNALSDMRGFPTRYRFTGREFETLSGLQYSRARSYDPQVGRFISEDPIGFAGGDINLYGYVGNSPLRFTDPLGLDGGPENYLRNPYSSDQWIKNGLSNTVSDVLGLDNVAKWSWTMGDHRCPTLDRVMAGGTLGLHAISTALGGATFGSAARGLVAGSSARLAHLTSARAATAIDSTGVLAGAGGAPGNIYATVTANASSGARAFMTTSVTAYEAAIPISRTAATAFSQPVPVGLFSGWQYVSGTQLTARGSLNLATGTFTRAGVNVNQVGVYAFDAVATPAIYGVTRTPFSGCGCR